jgi:two-component system KDP operon response regulator KdpE
VAADQRTVLVIEDHRPAQMVLLAAFEARGHRVLIAPTGAAAIDILDTAGADLVILDLGLPDVAGLDLVKHIRARVTCPIIVVTADADERRIVEALDSGADDYVTKPYSMPVLLARCRVGLRHGSIAAEVLDQTVLAAGDVRLDLGGMQVMVGDEVVEMHSRQFRLLSILVRNRGKVVTYAALDRALGEPGGEWTSERNPYRVSISKIRKLLGTGPARPVITTEYNVGYRLTVPSDPAAP